MDASDGTKLSGDDVKGIISAPESQVQNCVAGTGECTQMSGIECFLIIAHLCIHSVPSVTVEDSTVYKSAIIHGRGFQASVMWDTDNIKTPSWGKMSQLCGFEGCLAYFKHCDLRVKPNQCSYHFSQPGELQNTVVKVTASDASKIQRAESLIGVLVRAGWNTEEILLAKFSINSEASEPPYCLGRVPQSACWGEPKQQ
jgi:hypothetical protein